MVYNFSQFSMDDLDEDNAISNSDKPSGQGGSPGEYEALMAEQAALDVKIQEARARHLAGVVKDIQAKVVQFGLKPDDVFPDFNFSRKRNMSPAVPKYRDPDTGATWTGRGKAPVWIADKDREQFAIKATD